MFLSKNKANHLILRSFHSSTSNLFPRSVPWKSLKTTIEEKEEEESKPWDYNKSSTNQKDLFAESVEKEDNSPTTHNDHSFHQVQRPFQETEADSTTATEKERLIFTKILDSILHQRDKGRKSSSSHSNHLDRGVSSSLQALFESNDLESFSPSSQTKSNLPNVKLEIATEDVRKVPLSYSSLIQKDSTAQTQSKSVQIQQKERETLLSTISPVLNYIDSLETDQEVVNYYIDKITSRFDDSSTTSTPSTTTSTTSTSSTPINPMTPPLSKQYLPFYLHKCMSVLCKSFDDPSEAISLFEISKRVGIEFYACTCSVDVYNEILQIRWQYFRDLYAVESLVSEMHVNAVQGNERTVDILGTISRDCIDAKHGILGINGVPLWTKEDDERVRKLNQYRLRITASLASLEGFTIPFST